MFPSIHQLVILQLTLHSTRMITLSKVQLSQLTFAGAGEQYRWDDLHRTEIDFASQGWEGRGASRLIDSEGPFTVSKLSLDFCVLWQTLHYTVQSGR